MIIIVGKNARFCYGVQNAVSGAKKILEENKSTHCLSEIVYNVEVIKELNDKGIKIVDNIDEAKEKNNKSS